MEDALESRWGHWHEYLRTFKRGLEAAGDSVAFYVSRKCDDAVAESVGGIKTLPRSIWRRMGDGSPKWRRLLRIPAHALDTFFSAGRAVDLAKKASRNSEAATLPDIIFVPTVLVHHMLGWLLLIRLKLRRARTKVLLFFPNTPIEVVGDGKVVLAPEATSKLFYRVVKLFRGDVESGNVVLAAETVPMAEALTRLTGIPFRYLPHPVELSGETSRPHAGSESERGSGRPLLFGCYGAARWEKGSDLFQAAIAKVLNQRPDANAKFVFQWMEDFSDEDGAVASIDRELLTNPKVQILRDYFVDGQYEKQLAETDVMVLPYRRPYALRVSRVVIEAMSMGIPVITAQQTTLDQQAKQFGLGISCAQGSADDLARAICEAMDAFPRLDQAARGAAGGVRDHFSVAHFRHLIMGNMDSSGSRSK